MRFRLYEIVLLADIEKAFLQLAEEHGVTRFILAKRCSFDGERL